MALGTALCILYLARSYLYTHSSIQRRGILRTEKLITVTYQTVQVIQRVGEKRAGIEAADQGGRREFQARHEEIVNLKRRGTGRGLAS